MMTNKENIPEQIIRALEHNWYKNNAQQYATVTQLLKPTRMFILEQRYKDEITYDAADMLFMLMGSAMHEVLAKAETSSTFNEERLEAVVDGKIISGGIDLYENETIIDYKFASVRSFMSPDKLAEWEKQLNMYAYLYREAGFRVNKLEVIAIFRDWSKRRAAHESSYPRQVEVIDIPLWTQKQAREFISARIQTIETARRYPDDELPLCSKCERWQRSDRYAVLKQGNKKASRIFDEREEAEQYITEKTDSDKYYIELREQEAIRCADYCNVNKYCSFWHEMNATKAA